MNNRLKFRVWDTSLKEFSNYTNRDPFFCLSSGDIFFWERVRKENGDFVGDIIIQDTANRFIIQQSTGLKTASNQDIFEGDIIRFNLKYSDAPYIGEIAWSDESLSYIVYFSPDPTDQLVEDLSFVKSIEILGNIFESPDLLKNYQQI